MKTTRLLSTLILTVCLGFGSVMAQNAARQVCPEKAEKPCKVKLTPEQRMEAQAQRMGKQLMLDDAKLAQFTSLYKEYLTALKECRPAVKENKVKSKNIFGYSKTNSYSYIKDIDISSPKVKVISDICVDLNEKDYD